MNSPTILAAGDTVPSLRFARDGREHSLADVEGPVWVLFYPLAFAPTCRDDLRALDAAANELGYPHAPLLVCSVDRQEQAEDFLRFLETKNLTAVEDPSLELARGFGVARREGVAERATFLVRDGKVVTSLGHDLCLPRPLDDLRATWREVAPAS